MTDTVILDLDDFYEGNDGLDLLVELYKTLPGFKVNLFVIPGQTSLRFIQNLRTAYDWLDLIPHGWLHETSRECQDWNYSASLAYLNLFENSYWTLFTYGFKAPGWQISDGMYQALLAKGWWVADQSYNNDRRPAGLRAYLLDEGPETRIHGHLGHLGGHNANALELIYDTIVEQAQGKSFKFIKEVL